MSSERTYFCRNRVRHNGKLYTPGNPIKLTEKDAAPLLATHAISKHDPAKTAENAEKIEAEKRAQAEKEAKEKAEAEAKAKAEAEEKARQEAETKAKAEAQANQQSGQQASNKGEGGNK